MSAGGSWRGGSSLSSSELCPQGPFKEVTEFQGEAREGEIEVRGALWGWEKLGGEKLGLGQAFHQTQPLRFMNLLHTQTPHVHKGGVRRERRQRS